MDRRRFRKSRSDGTSEVAARFSSATCMSVERASEEWRTRRGSELANEFDPVPYVDKSRDEVLLVFPIRADARMWKDYMVEATREAESAGGEILGFLDRVTGRRHHE